MSAATKDDGTDGAVIRQDAQTRALKKKKKSSTDPNNGVSLIKISVYTRTQIIGQCSTLTFLQSFVSVSFNCLLQSFVSVSFNCLLNLEIFSALVVRIFLLSCFSQSDLIIIAPSAHHLCWTIWFPQGILFHVPPSLPASSLQANVFSQIPSS